MVQSSEALAFPLAREREASEQQAWSRLARTASTEDYAAAWLELQAAALDDVEAGLVLVAAEDGRFAPLALHPAGAEVGAELSIAAELCLSERKGVVRQPEKSLAPGAGAPTAIALPLLFEERLFGAVAFQVRSRGPEQTRRTMRALQWGVAWLEVMARRRSLLPSARLVDVLDLVATALEGARFFPAASAVCGELASLFSCDWVAIGFTHGRRHARVAALSNSAALVRSSRFVAGVAAAMDEAIDQDDAVRFPEPGDARPLVARAHEALAAEGGSGCVLTIPLRAGERLVGAVTLRRPLERPFAEVEVETCRQACALLGPALEAKRREDRFIGAKVWEAGTGALGRLVGPRHLGRKLALAAAAAVVILLATYEVPRTISATATLEGAVQRALTAPMAGYVAAAEARAGDVVAAGDLLARLDDRELTMERARWESQLDQRRQEHRQALAAGDRSQLGVLAAQIEQARARLDLIEEQLARVEIRAPFAGVIVRGDLTRALGAPVERGQVLYEVAPLDDYRVALAVDEWDITGVAVGQEAQLVLSAMPQARFPLTITTITPVSTSAEGRTTFRVEGELGERGERLRPGMEGVAKIATGEGPLGDVLARRTLHWARLTAWSWLP